MDEGEGTMEPQDSYLQIRLHTKSPRFAVTDIPYSIPTTTASSDLNLLVNQLLGESAVENWIPVDFDFLINGDILLTSVGEYVQQQQISSENVISIEYIERAPAPEPDRSLEHRDWVSAVHSFDDYILTGAYDNSVRVWNSRDGQLVLSHAAHTAPIKGVCWTTSSSFLTASHDQTVALWNIDEGGKNVSPRAFFRGHANSVDALSLSPDRKKFCSVSWDKTLKIWSLEDDATEEIAAPADKKFKGENRKNLTKTPEMTLPGHKEAVSCCAWTGKTEIITGSWDHSIRIWDVELGGVSRQLDSSKAFTSLSYSSLNRTVISGSSDRLIRLYDPRSHEGSVVKLGFLSHSGWVSSVAWSPNNDHLFISGSYDKVMKMWDARSPKAPLYDMAGHSDKILCCSWSDRNLLLSGGADSALKVFSAARV
ncbi:hypothetical protein RvY_06164 [Ramazzottius varieornatus]|uniref:Ribosome biogenesis protein WDR12 homolog n=1 Tax=Ramazzottius varieornatus TaxID=947166 RepID=A0A1D1V332_RAMVA|nr:hypothetical protein RvY_06164 [Ramazzottius varieornatus]